MAGRIQGITVEIGGDTTKLQTALKGVNTEIRNTQSQLRDVDKLLTIATTNADGSMRELSDILADCRTAFSGLSESEKAAAAESLVGKNAMSGFLALMNAGEADINKLSSAIDNCDGSAASMAETMNAPVAIEKPDDYEARANLMWASSWGLNGFLFSGVSQDAVAHMIEHEVSAFYDITHGHGLAIIIPKWLSYILSEKTAPKIKRFGVNVLGVDASLSDMDGAKAAIEALEKFFYETLGLKSRLASQFEG